LKQFSQNTEQDDKEIKIVRKLMEGKSRSSNKYLNNKKIDRREKSQWRRNGNKN
jgi:hypothetical protein